MSELLPFRISSALKNIIGKELITDEFVAVYELVKNSFDAYATKVQIIFEQADYSIAAKILVKDNGKGMNINDINNRWLFVAYSAKKTGIENNDYREKIKINRVFAGAKGVGRFSCDRLGSVLYMETIKSKNPTEAITVFWDEFEVDPLREFVEVKVRHSTLTDSKYKLKYGTVLEISGLRDEWSRERLLRLKRALVKLVNPNQENDSRSFEIEILAKHEIEKDNLKQEDYEKVNGKIENKLFEQLKIKTTNIAVEISPDGDTITSTLEDRGDFIYKLIEKNPFNAAHFTSYNAPLLANIKVYLFQLNQSAKAAFYKIMGMRSIDYGAVFMYKNGFRIYPFGEPGEDILLIDRRKGQGYSRFLGNRDLIGRIEIYGDNDELRETTSRDGGLVKTDSYHQLSNFFYEYVLKRLENYVVNIIKWGDESTEKSTGDIISSLGAKDVKLQILELITGLIKSEDVINIEYNHDFLNIIDAKSNSSVDKAIKNISKVAEKSNNPQLVKEAQKLNKVFKQIKGDIKIAEDKAAKAEKKLEKTEEQLGYIIGQNNFLKNEISDDTKNLESILHHIGLTTNFVKMDLENLVRSIAKDAPKAELIKIVKRLSTENQKITSFAKYFKKVNFNIHSNRVEKDVISFIDEYLENVYKLRIDLKNNRELLDVNILTPQNAELFLKFNPIDLIIIIDNLINNSFKAEAKHVTVSWKNPKKDSIVLSFQDDGKGIKENLVQNIFDFGFTTTNGSGLGLYHVQELISKMKGSISVNTNLPKGVEFLITFKK